MKAVEVFILLRGNPDAEYTGALHALFRTYKDEIGDTRGLVKLGIEIVKSSRDFCRDPR